MWKGRADDRSRHVEYRAVWDDLSGALRLVQSACHGAAAVSVSRRGRPRRVAASLWIEAWSLDRVLTELRHGRLAVLSIVLAEAQRQRYFPLAQGPLTSVRTAAATPCQGQCSG